MTITILLADDHAVVRDGLRSLLNAELDLEVVSDVANGREAVNQATQHCPDVAILDIAMPELNGIDAAKQIYEVCSDIKIIILSMHASDEHISRALQVGVRGYLLKDSAGIEVTKAVRAVYEGQRYLSPKISDKLVEDYIRQGQHKSDDPLARLTSRELEIMQLVVEGKSSAEIADILSLSPKTVETYRSRLMQKLGLSDLPSLVKFAIQQGLISLD